MSKDKLEAKLNELKRKADVGLEFEQVDDDIVSRMIVDLGKNKIKLIQSLRVLLDSNHKLANEAQGFLSLANPDDHGHTNIECLRMRIDKARQARAEVEKILGVLK